MTTTEPTDLKFRTATPSDITTLYHLEYVSYRSDEAASLSSITTRVRDASSYFLLAIHDNKVAGFVNGTRCDSFTHETMTTHIPTGRLLAIHSVVINEVYRNRGWAKEMLCHYIKEMTAMEGIEKIVLLAKANLLPFYINAGFQVMGKSAIDHGKDLWYDLQFTIKKQDEEEGTSCFIVDSFSDRELSGPYNASGNPAGVVIMKGERDTMTESHIQWMENIATEFNLAETAFLWKKTNSAKDWDVRYYTRTGAEVDLCGHATLASAAVLSLNHPHHSKFTFYAKKDILHASPLSSLSSSSATAINRHQISIAMDLPYKTLLHIPTTHLLYPDILSMLQTALQILENDIIFLGTTNNNDDLFVEITPTAFHQSLPQSTEINYDVLASSSAYTRGISICCDNTTNPHEGISKGDSIDFYSRFFGPKVGIPEDPVTGSSFCLLAPYFASKLNKAQMTARQMSPRGGIVKCVIKEEEDDSSNSDLMEKKCVCVIGLADVVMKGKLCV